ncbi:LCP family protein [Anaerobacillus sp. HL2]|nr:LCP family protein [Anaerobacillus sp. HL2]
MRSTENERINVAFHTRDTYIYIPNHGYDKLNKSFQIGGAKLTREIISDWLEMEINETAAIDYSNFEQLIDLIGGLELYVDRQMVHNEFSFRKRIANII